MLEVVEALYTAMFTDPDVAARIVANPDAALAGRDLTDSERAAVIADAEVLSADVDGFAKRRPALRIQTLYPAVLFFDEADALFGRRTNVADTDKGDRKR